MITTRTVGAGTSQVQVTDIMISVDTTAGASNLQLPSIASLKAYRDRSGYNLQPIQFFFTNIGSGSNTMTITPSTLDMIDGLTSIILSKLGASGVITATSDNKWTSNFAPENSALSPSYPLGESASYVILTPAALTIGTANQGVTGNIGQLGAITGSVVFNSGADYPAPISNQAVTDATTLYNQLVALTPTFNFLSGAVVLDTVDTGHGAGIFKAGIYKGNAAANTDASSIVTFDGDGDYVFIFNGAITTGANTTFVLKNGAKASRIFFASSAAMTTGANTIWKGTSVSPAGQTTGANTNLEGRLLSTVAAITTGAGAGSYYLPIA